MSDRYHIFGRRNLLLVLTALLTTGFFATAISSYFISKQTILNAIIGQDLPLTSSNIYSEIQKDLIQPVLISSTMANDSFVRDWVLRGEKDVGEMTRYLSEIKQHYNAFSSFFVSEATRNYYTATGVLKHVSPSEPRDAWYFRVRAMQEPYEINVDPDLANNDSLTIFINYRAFDFAGNYIGATGIGLTVNAVRRLVDEYQTRFKRTIFFVDGKGKVVIGNKATLGTDLHSAEGLGDLIDPILRARSGSFKFEAAGDIHVLHVNYLPELKWYLFVEQNQDTALKEIRHTLYANLVISLIITLIVITLTHLVLIRYQQRMEDMATTDKLTGLLNRHAFSILLEKFLAKYRRDPKPLTLLMVDIDFFKVINDSHGHRVGDEVLKVLSGILTSGLRESDIAVRWGGEEFLLALQDCGLAEGVRIAENLRETVAQASFGTDGQPLNITISIGASQYDGSENPEHAINRADAALYEAKNTGRNRVCQV